MNVENVHSSGHSPVSQIATHILSSTVSPTALNSSAGTSSGPVALRLAVWRMTRATSERSVGGSCSQYSCSGNLKFVCESAEICLRTGRHTHRQNTFITCAKCAWGSRWGETGVISPRVRWYASVRTPLVCPAVTEWVGAAAGERRRASHQASATCKLAVYKKLSYRRETARCALSVEILPTATQKCRNYLHDKSWIKYQLSLIDPCDKIVL